MDSLNRRPVPAALLVVLLLATPMANACSARRSVPPAPALPEVRFVPPCDPDAAIGLTAEEEKDLVVRDRLMQERIQELEALLGGGR